MAMSYSSGDPIHKHLRRPAKLIYTMRNLFIYKFQKMIWLPITKYTFVNKRCLIFAVACH